MRSCTCKYIYICIVVGICTGICTCIGIYFSEKNISMVQSMYTCMYTGTCIWMNSISIYPSMLLFRYYLSIHVFLCMYTFMYVCMNVFYVVSIFMFTFVSTHAYTLCLSFTWTHALGRTHRYLAANSQTRTLTHNAHTNTHIQTHTNMRTHVRMHNFFAFPWLTHNYGVATISRLLNTIGLLCKRAL